MLPGIELCASARREEPRNRTFLSLLPRPPFRLDATVWALRRRPENTIDRWDGSAYRRAFALPEGRADVAVRETGTVSRPRLAVEIASRRPIAEGAPRVVGLLERMLGTAVDLAGFYAMAARDPLLAPLAERFRGVKPPRFPTLFEALVNAIACQQLSLAMGIRLLGRLAELGGQTSRRVHGRSALAFPAAERVAMLRPAALRQAGFSRQKAAAILDIARAAARGDLDAERFSALDDASALARLRELRGIGRWSAEYLLLRGLGRWHVFPGDDVGARNHLERWLGLRRSLDYDGVRQVVRRWRPYEGIVYFHLLLKQLSEHGCIA